MKTLIYIICFLLILVFTVSLSGCINEENEFDATVGTWRTAQTIQPYVYHEHIGEDYSMNVLPFTNPGDQKSALLAGGLDMTGTTIALAITGASKGEPIVIVSSLCNKCSAIVVREGSDIETPADLKGKTIAYVPGTMHHVLLLETLKKEGLDPNEDVVLKRIDFFDMGQALSRGTVDAFCSGEPYPSVAVAEGYGRILTYPYYGDNIGTINAGMITTKDKIENDRDKIQVLVTAHARTTQHLNQNKDEWLTLAETFGTSRDVLEIAEPNMELVWDIDDDYIENTRNLAIEMYELGMINNVPDIDSMFDLSFVEEARNNTNNTNIN